MPTCSRIVSALASMRTQTFLAQHLDGSQVPGQERHRVDGPGGALRLPGGTSTPTSGLFHDAVPDYIMEQERRKRLRGLPEGVIDVDVASPGVTRAAGSSTALDSIG